jgi:hypothetical protein
MSKRTDKNFKRGAKNGERIERISMAVVFSYPSPLDMRKTDKRTEGT